jgi:diaminohydroxyphosphoribosylaminopyrimidine deaminase/5-amino-6-(5-phosphoribosylamino)uracil reductase
MYEGKKQAPCTNRIIKEKISTVVISMVDPNPFVNGLGIKQLKEAGIVVISGILEDESRKLNEVFIKNKTKSLPFVHLKIAQTLDGKIATESNNSQWITDEDARKDVHKLRSLYDSVLIGSGTVLIDDPLLTIRYGIDKPICRIILDSKLKTPLHSNLLQNDQKNETYIFTGNNVDQDQITPYIQENVKIVKISINDENQIDLNELLRKLYQLGICSVLVEGGSQIFTSFIHENLFDKLTVYISPKICGSGISSVNNLGTEIMDDSLQLKRTEIKEINNQIVFSGYRI